MKRTYLFAGVTVAALVATAVAWTLARSGADQGEPQTNAKPGSPLPIAQVVLFNSGVGYLQREGEITGDTRVELTFPTSDVNDLLKSLILQDSGGGQVGAISYDSQDPAEKILHSFALDLNNNPTFGQILNQARGEKIEVMRQEKPGANPFKVSGTIIGIESHKQTAGKDGAVDVEQLNLLTAEGMLSVPLAQVLSVRFQNQTLESDFRRALQVLAGSHDVQKKTVALQFNGKGKRPVRVGYVVERPIWKTTYRLELKPNDSLFMQGWAIVENTSDDDWNNVRMVLVSGKPISYRMDLYQPLYVPRPLVEPELFASLRPPVYGGSFSAAEVEKVVKDLLGDPERAQAKAGMAQKGGGGFGGAGAGGGGFGGFGGGLGGGGGGIGGFGQGLGGNPGSENVKPPRLPIYVQPLPALGVVVLEKGGTSDLAEMVKRAKKAAEDAKTAGSAIAGLNFKEGIQSIASAGEIGDYFQYVIDQKVNLARQKSAMLPILNQTVAGSKVSIFNEAVHAKFPLLGIRLKNTSGKPLTQGPITVYEGGSYAGDTRTLDLQPNEERLLSYALDLGMEVKTTVKTHPAPEMTFNIGGNNLTARYTMREIATYTVKNRSPHDRTLIIEHPIREDWKLVDPKIPSEQSRDVYRFQVAVKAGETVTQSVVEEQTRTDPVALQAGKDQAPYYAIFSGIDIKPEVKNSGAKLQSLSIHKGVLEATYLEKESKTYFIQNQSDRDHVFTIDHVIRKDWTRVEAGGKDQPGPDVFRFKVEVKSKKTAQQEVVEQHIFEDHSTVVAFLDESAMRRFIGNPAPSAKVKAALQEVLDKWAKLKTALQQVADAKADLKILAEDQARVRENLKIIPQTSEHYKDFLKKFVAQETQIEEMQRQIRTQEAAVQTMEKEYAAFVATLTVQ